MKGIICHGFNLAAVAWLASVSVAAQPPSAPPSAANPSAPIPMDQLGAVAGKQYQGDGLSVTATSDGARLRCAFQRLEGEATRDGLWLRSTAGDAQGERFRVVAVAVGRTEDHGVGRQSAAATPLFAGDWLEVALPEFQSGVALCFPPQSKTLPVGGSVSVNGQTVRFSRPGLMEEYSVSVNGVRQDFIVEQRPEGEGELRVELDVTGARAEPLVNGARLVLDGSGRKLAYNRLRVTDAKGHELPARIEVAAGVSPAEEGGILPPGGGARTMGVSGFNCDEFASSGPSAGLPVLRSGSATEDGEATALQPAETPAATMLAVVVDDTAATYPVRIDPTFSDANWTSMNPSMLSADNGISAAVVDASGNLYVGGYFTVAGDQIANRVAKWDGSSWKTLGSGMNSPVVALVVSGGDLYAGGYFTTAGGTAANRVAKWNGSSWTALGSGMNSVVLALVVSGGDLYAGGDFTIAGGTAANRVAKWDGSSWTPLASGMNYYVRALAVSGSALYAGGGFTNAGGNAANFIAKWDGSTWSALGSGMNYDVNALAVSGSDLYAGGYFTNAGGSEANCIAKWNDSTWTALGTGIGGGIDPNVPFVLTLAVSGTNVYAGGFFTTAGGNTANYIARWDGSSWTPLSSGMNDWVTALAVSGSDLYAGGYFRTADGSNANHIAKWNGSNWTALGSSTGIDSSVRALTATGSNLYAGGFFTTAGGTTANRIAKWDGGSWSTLGLGMDNTVYALAALGSNLYAGGAFTTADGNAANYIANWNGNSWTAMGSGMNASVRALAVLGSNVYAGGAFTTAGGTTVNRIAKWNGSSWMPLGSGMNNSVFALAVLGTNVYAGGAFTTAGGTTANRIAKWNGSSWSALGSGVSDYVHALAALGNELYVAGGFVRATNAGLIAITVNRVAKWNESSWSALGSGMNDLVLALAPAGSNLYAGGQFTTAGGSAANRIAKWNGSSWTALGLGISGGNSPFVSALAVSGNDLYVGGSFTTAGGKVSAYVARAYLPTLPTLSVFRSGADVTVSWPSIDLDGFGLEQTDMLVTPANWVTNTTSVTDDGTNKSVNLPATNSAQFFRLRRP